MSALSESALLLAWEEGTGRPPLRRPLAALRAAGVGEGAEAMSIGRRDAELLALREQTFGRDVDAVTDCAACGEMLELSFDTGELELAPATPDGGPWSVAVGEAEVLFRLPTTVDLEAVAHHTEVDAAEAELIERCVLAPPAAELTDAERRAIDERMAELDPLATVELEVRCPACEADGRSVFDVASFLWAEIDAAACHTLEAVHVLASAYGWREQDVLALSPERRRLYLELIG